MVEAFPVAAVLVTAEGLGATAATDSEEVWARGLAEVDTVDSRAGAKAWGTDKEQAAALDIVEGTGWEKCNIGAPYQVVAQRGEAAAVVTFLTGRPGSLEQFR